MGMGEISKLEIDILLLFYTFSDQFGRVDMVTASHWAKTKLGAYIPEKQFIVTQEHIDVLMDSKVIPDTRELLRTFVGPLPPQSMR